MVKKLLFITLLFWGCTNNPEVVVSNLEEVSKEISGEYIGRKTPYINKSLKNRQNEVHVFVSHKKFITQEIDIHFKKNSEIRFLELREYYNNKFQSSQKDSIYNTWHTDSTDFILYKNSDSSILVNIFKRK